MPAFLSGIATTILTNLHIKFFNNNYPVEMPAFLSGIATYYSLHGSNPPLCVEMPAFLSGIATFFSWIYIVQLFFIN